MAAGHGTEKQTRATQLLAHLREAVLSGHLAPGAKLNVQQLRAQHQVSLSPLREALARLSAEGLVELEDNRGYRVTPLTPEHLQEIVLLRSHLEPLALKHAIRNGDLAWESEVMRALHRLVHTNPGPDAVERRHPWEAAHAAFHQALVAGCGMPLLLRHCATLRNQHARYWRLRPSTPAGAQAMADDHRNLAKQATTRNVDAACALLRAHIQSPVALEN